MFQSCLGSPSIVFRILESFALLRAMAATSALLYPSVDQQVERVRPDIPDHVLALAWSPQVQSQYHIDAKAFYATRQARGVSSRVRRGPKQALGRSGVDTRHLDRAVRDETIGRSTAEHYKKLRRRSSSAASKLAVLYPPPPWLPWRDHCMYLQPVCRI